MINKRVNQLNSTIMEIRSVKIKESEKVNKWLHCPRKLKKIVQHGGDINHC